MIKSVIDIGTNSVKLCVGDVDSKKIIHIICDVNVITRLGEKMGINGALAPNAIERTAVAVQTYVKEARKLGSESVSIVGTMALRAASNSEVLKKRIKELTNIDIITLSGEEEAEYSYKAAISTLCSDNNEECLIFDTGGGSTEFIYGKHGHIRENKSLNIGAVRVTEEMFETLPIGVDFYKEALKKITTFIQEGKILRPCSTVIGLGGNVTSLSAVNMGLSEYNAELIHGSILKSSDVDRLISYFITHSVSEIQQIKGLNPSRAEVITAGAVIVRAILDITGATELIVCDRGLRHEFLCH